LICVPFFFFISCYYYNLFAYIFVRSMAREAARLAHFLVSNESRRVEFRVLDLIDDDDTGDRPPMLSDKVVFKKKNKTKQNNV
jgi:hypothetical protein